MAIKIEDLPELDQSIYGNETHAFHPEEVQLAPLPVGQSIESTLNEMDIILDDGILYTQDIVNSVEGWLHIEHLRVRVSQIAFKALKLSVKREDTRKPSGQEVEDIVAGIYPQIGPAAPPAFSHHIMMAHCCEALLKQGGEEAAKLMVEIADYYKQIIGEDKPATKAVKKAVKKNVKAADKQREKKEQEIVEAAMEVEDNVHRNEVVAHLVTHPLDVEESENKE